MKSKFKPLPDALFARDPDVMCELGCTEGEVVDDTRTFGDGQSCRGDGAATAVNQAAGDADQAAFEDCCSPGACDFCAKALLDVDTELGSSHIRWTCRKAYYVLKYGHLPPDIAREVAYWWGYQTECGCDGKNTNDPDN